MGRSNRYTKEDVLKAIKKSSGIMSTIAGRLGCNWHTAKKYVYKWADTMQAMKDEEEAIKDLAEGQLYKSIASGDASTIKWYLSKKAKDRGYGDETLEEKVAEIADTEIKIINDFELAQPAEPAPEGPATDGA